MKNFPRELPHGSGATLVLDATRLLIEFTEQAVREDADRALDRFDLMPEPDAGTSRPEERPRAEITPTRGCGSGGRRVGDLLPAPERVAEPLDRLHARTPGSSRHKRFD